MKCNIDTKLPLFEYGLLKPGQPAFSIIKKYVSNVLSNFIIQGEIWEINGFPVLDNNGFNEINGTLLFFNNENVYDHLKNILPDSLYAIKSLSIRNKNDNSYKQANVLISCTDVTLGIPFYSNTWDIQKQPIFVEALSLVREIIDANSNFAYDLKNIFLLKLAYLQLLEIIERFISLKYICINPTFENLSLIANDETFKEQLKKHVTEKRVFQCSNIKNKKLYLDPSNPLESFHYYYYLKFYNISKNILNPNECNHLKLALRELYEIFVHLKYKTLQTAKYDKNEDLNTYISIENSLHTKNEKIELYADFLKKSFSKLNNSPINFKKDKIDWNHIASHFLDKNE